MLLVGSQFCPQSARDAHDFGRESPLLSAPTLRASQGRGHDRGVLLSNASSREGGVRKRRAGAEDVEIGRKIRALRLERGLSQSGLADGIGLTFQQVQKYEKGTNRVSAGRLQKIADILNTPVTFFYGSFGVQGKKRDPR